MIVEFIQEIGRGSLRGAHRLLNGFFEREFNQRFDLLFPPLFFFEIIRSFFLIVCRAGADLACLIRRRD